MEEIVDVVSALIFRDGKFLICQRPESKPRGLMWELAGGKVEPGETGPQALARECREELGIEVQVGQVFHQCLHRYPDVTIQLTTYRATILSGEPQPLEHKRLRWITPAEIHKHNFIFSRADLPVLAMLQK